MTGRSELENWNAQKSILIIVKSFLPMNLNLHDFITVKDMIAVGETESLSAFFEQTSLRNSADAFDACGYSISPRTT
jgi:hypothetical protein